MYLFVYSLGLVVCFTFVALLLVTPFTWWGLCSIYVWCGLCLLRLLGFGACLQSGFGCLFVGVFVLTPFVCLIWLVMIILFGVGFIVVFLQIDLWVYSFDCCYGLPGFIEFVFVLD